jgi:hypothetical protein
LISPTAGPLPVALYFSQCDEKRIVVEKDGPLNCQGELIVIDDEDSDLLLPQADHFTLCRCGASKKKPLCDGSHLENGFKG